MQNLVGGECTRREIEVADGATEECVAYRPADQCEFVSGGGEGGGKPSDHR